MTPNERAFLDVIAQSEGTKDLGDSGYNVLVGGELFHDYSDHPHPHVFIKRIGQYSSAAGRYQLLGRYFITYKDQLKLPDFSPTSQDKIALQQIKECDALDDVRLGNFDVAINKCSRIWASLPGNNYGQRQNSLQSLCTAYISFGGELKNA